MRQDLHRLTRSTKHKRSPGRAFRQTERAFRGVTCSLVLAVLMVAAIAPSSAEAPRLGESSLDPSIVAASSSEGRLCFTGPWRAHGAFRCRGGPAFRPLGKSMEAGPSVMEWAVSMPLPALLSSRPFPSLNLPARRPRPKQDKLEEPGQKETDHVADRDLVCSLIETESGARDIPVFLLARLLWTESHFNPAAISPKGAKGIAQFMPATAADRGLDDPFDVRQAIPHSALYLRDLRDQFGSFGLAAAAYNAGPERVSDWLSDRRRLPLETRKYVASITGISADDWKEGRVHDLGLKWPDEETFPASCTTLAATLSRNPDLSGRKTAARRASRKFPPLVACAAGRLCSVSGRR